MTNNATAALAHTLAATAHREAAAAIRDAREAGTPDSGPAAIEGLGLRAVNAEIAAERTAIAAWQVQTEADRMAYARGEKHAIPEAVLHALDMTHKAAAKRVRTSQEKAHNKAAEAHDAAATACKGE